VTAGVVVFNGGPCALIMGKDLTERVRAEAALRDREARYLALGASPRGGQDVTVSIGVSASRYGDIFDYDRIFERADAALYRAKNGGRNQVCVADEIDANVGADAGFTRHVRV